MIKAKSVGEHRISQNWPIFDWNYVFWRTKKHLSGGEHSRGLLMVGIARVLLHEHSTTLRNNTLMQPPEKPAELAKKTKNYWTYLPRAKQFPNDLYVSGVALISKFFHHNVDGKHVNMFWDHLCSKDCEKNQRKQSCKYLVIVKKNSRLKKKLNPIN